VTAHREIAAVESTDTIESTSTKLTDRVTDNPARWHDFFEGRVGHWELGDRRPRAEAERLAWAEMQSRWQMEHCERVPREICAGCRRPIGTATALDLIDGSRVHLHDGNPCLIRHGKRWRAAAAWALMAFGLRLPVGVDQ
jgi:hypothetical protein